MSKLIDLTNQTFNEWMVIERDLNCRKKDRTYWICKCSCGTIKSIDGHALKQGGSTRCRQHPRPDKVRNLVGQTFNNWLVEKWAYRKNKKSHWYCVCQCGYKKIVCLEDLTGGRSKGCKNCNNDYYEEMSGSFWSTVKRGAITRNLEFTITKNYVWNLFIKQNRRCIFSGIELKFSTKINLFDGNASLDRIDSTKGYIEGNVQWVDKRINIMKQNMTDNEFIEICKMIAEYRK